MSEPIRVGDLVQIVRTTLCCNNIRAIGATFIAKKIRDGNRAYCVSCGSTEPVAVVDGLEFTTDIRRLRRIPPLSELEGRTTEEGLRVPAAPGKVKA